MRALDALGNPVRRQILEKLRDRAQSVGELSSHFPISRPAISRHLRVLESANLVACEPRGRKHLFSLNNDGFVEVERYLGSFWIPRRAAR